MVSTRSPDDLVEDNDDWESLGAKLEVALLQCARGETARKLGLLVDRWRKQGIVCSGRYLLWFVLYQFVKDGETDPAESLGDLYDVRCNGDEDLEKFLTTWSTVLELCSEPISESVLRALFLKQLRKCPLMARDIAIYELYDILHANRSFSW